MALKSWQVIGSVVLITSITVLMQISSETWITSATVSLIMGASALACMASSCILASRWHGIERLFGGLDRVYERISGLLYGHLFSLSIIFYSKPS